MKQTVKTTIEETRELPDVFVCNTTLYNKPFQWYRYHNGKLTSIYMSDSQAVVVSRQDGTIDEFDLRNGITEISVEEFKSVLARAIAIINAE